MKYVIIEIRDCRIEEDRLFCKIEVKVNERLEELSSEEVERDQIPQLIYDTHRLNLSLNKIDDVKVQLEDYLKKSFPSEFPEIEVKSEIQIEEPSILPQDLIELIDKEFEIE